MTEYQASARKFRPQIFAEVVGQDLVIATLKNAIRYDKLAHAYLFSGSRGVGKTTLARILAKALNCQAKTKDLEPCNECSSCKEIMRGASLDVLEIDGASNRGIDDIRTINETVAYTPASGKYKIYIIDEVHMLTKEAFNALLKTLEEPPPKVKFFFATTEPQKVLPTILSRCQRFNLKRIPNSLIATKLQHIAKALDRKVDEGALRLIAQRSEGGLRDAESFLDQILAFHEGAIGEKEASSVLGVVPKEAFFTLDEEGNKGNLAAAFSIAYTIFSEGKDLTFFIEGLLEHFRNLSLVKLSGKDASFLDLSESERERYAVSECYYSKEQLLTILDICLEAHSQIREMPSARIAIEALLLRIMRTHQKIPLDLLVQKLAEFEKRLSSSPSEKSAASNKLLENSVASSPPIPLPTMTFPSNINNVTEDPTPTVNDLKGIVQEKSKKVPVLDKKKQSQYDTLFQFASVELEGRIQKT